MSLNELVDVTAANCKQRKRFFRLEATENRYVAYKWLVKQPGINVENAILLGEMLGYSYKREVA